MPFPDMRPHRESASERAPHGSGATDSRDVFRAVSKDGAGRARAVASVLASVSDGISDDATAVCIRQATPPLAKEPARVLRCRRARPGRFRAEGFDRGDEVLARATAVHHDIAVLDVLAPARSGMRH
jgi:hypothetical protein